jgi:uncharacterized protein YgiM (DUF1202 family)
VVVATDALNLRSDAGTDGRIVTVLGTGMRLMITDGPRDDDGYTWYKVNVLGDSDEGPLTGWVAEDFIELEDRPTDIGNALWVEVSDGPVNMREAPGLEADIVDTLSTGETADVLRDNGLDVADGYTWLHVEQDGGESGWIAIDFLTPLSSDPGDGGGTPDGFEDALGVEVVDGPVNVRQDAGLDQTIVGTLQTGAEVPVAVSGELVSADGYDWIEVRFGNGIPGFVATDFLAPLAYSPNLGSSDALSAFVDVEGAFVTDGPLNIRAEPGTSSDILLTLESGDFVWVAQPVIENTATVGDYIWIVVDVAGETGWVAIDFISPAE